MQAYPEGSCLRFPETIPSQREVTYDAALMMLLKAAATAQTVPFSWSYVDKPADGTVLLLYLPHNSPYPNDGIRWQDNEIKAIIPAGLRELEVCEIKFGFVPNSGESSASRLRRRYRLLKGGNPQLVLIHYTRGQGMMINPAAANQPVRPYPLIAISEPAVFVAGEKQGQKVYRGGGGGAQGMGMGGGGGGGVTGGGGGGIPGQGMGMGMGAGMGMGGGPGGMGMGGMHPSGSASPGHLQGSPGPGSVGLGPGGGLPTMVPSVGGGGMGGGGVGGLPGANAPGGGPGLGMNLSSMSMHQQQALLAQQNSHMEALERRRERERANAAQASQQGARGHHRLPDEDDGEKDEIDQISTRTIALARYKRNHDWMNQVFYQAAFGKTTFPTKANETAPVAPATAAATPTTTTQATNPSASNAPGSKASAEPKNIPSTTVPAYSIFNKNELETKMKSLQVDIEKLQRQAEELKAVKTSVQQQQRQQQQHHHQQDVTMSSPVLGQGIVV